MMAGLSACAPKKTEVFSVDAALYPYYQTFVTQGKIRGKSYDTNNLVMKFGAMPSASTLGYCTTEYSNNNNILDPKERTTPVVVIDEARWSRSSEVQRRELIYHELGHCLMKKDHETRTNGFAPESLMYPYSISYNYPAFFAQWEVNYLDQLFGLRTYALTETDFPVHVAKTGSAETNASSVPEGQTKTYYTTVEGCEHDVETIRLMEEEHSHDHE